jgi:hypothetical protein
MNHHIDVVQVVQAPNTHTREIMRAREAITKVHSAPAEGTAKHAHPMPFSALSLYSG